MLPGIGFDSSVLIILKVAKMIAILLIAKQYMPLLFIQIMLIIFSIFQLRVC